MFLSEQFLPGGPEPSPQETETRTAGRMDGEGVADGHGVVVMWRRLGQEAPDLGWRGRAGPVRGRSTPVVACDSVSSAWGCSLSCFAVCRDCPVPAVGQGPPHSKSASPSGGSRLEASAHCQRPWSWREADLGPSGREKVAGGPQRGDQGGGTCLQVSRRRGARDLWPRVVVRSPFRCCHPLLFNGFCTCFSSINLMDVPAESCASIRDGMG